MFGYRVGGIVVLAVALAAAACGGSKGEAKSSADAQAGAQADVPAMDQLKFISTDLQAHLNALMAPINETDALIGQITSMPQRLNVNAKALMGMCKATLDNGQVQIAAEFNADAAVRAEVEGVMMRLKAIVDGLKAMPQNAQVLTVKAGSAVVAVPALGTKITAEATVKLNNPFGKPEVKAQAQADLQSLAQVQADVQATISQVQQQVMGLPAMATSALAKLAAAFAS
ncbi:MAG: hypothetical protein M0R80_31015 [Proteobacteria bacterium]|jgi:hypothetical protein|nr:hypothetical protein [Pseudomonadota bacterium]